MKLLVSCMIIILNISDNGKASVDTYLPANTMLFEDTTINSDKSCSRPCKFNVKPRRCYYSFIIEPTIQDDGKPVITVNGLTPGPPINVCLNDIIFVKVHNKIPGQDLAIHWHGVDQKGTPYMDGVPMITQCPITYGSIYKYAFKASAPGTYFYHSDSVAHQSDGVYGSLIVNQPQPVDPHSSLYDYDRSKEHTLMISARFPVLLTGNLEDLSRLRPNSLTVNGNEDNSKIFVMPSFAYRIRLINAITMECPVHVHIDQHEMMVISSDGKPVKPQAARNVLLYPGERMDVVVRASQKNGGYWVDVRGAGACAGLYANAMFLYSGFNYTTMLQERQMHLNVGSELDSHAVYGQMLKALQDVSHRSNVKFIYLGINRSIVTFNESDNEFRYTRESSSKPFFPAALTVQESGVFQINGKSFLYPNAPILLRPRDVRSEICYVGDEDKVKDPQCVLVLNALVGEVLEIALVNEGISNEPYTFHLHGFNMQVVATWKNPHEVPLKKHELHGLLKNGKIIRNLKNPVIKDTVTVPNAGLTIVRIHIDQGGSWLLECRSCSLSSLPAAVLINVPISIPKIVNDAMPKCGTYKPADILLN